MLNHITGQNNRHLLMSKCSRLLLFSHIEVDWVIIERPPLCTNTRRLIIVLWQPQPRQRANITTRYDPTCTLWLIMACRWEYEWRDPKPWLGVRQPGSANWINLSVNSRRGRFIIKDLSRCETWQLSTYHARC